MDKYYYSHLHNRITDTNIPFMFSYKYEGEDETGPNSESIKLLKFGKKYDLANLSLDEVFDDLSAFLITLNDNREIKGRKKHGVNCYEVGGKLAVYVEIYVLASNHAAAQADASAFVAA
jgi:hypothetical protein